MLIFRTDAEIIIIIFSVPKKTIAYTILFVPVGLSRPMSIVYNSFTIFGKNVAVKFAT